MRIARVLIQCCYFVLASAAAVVGGTALGAQTPTTAPSLSGTVSFRIDAQSVNEALKQFASQANLQLIYETQDIDASIHTSGVIGSLTPDEALRRLLAHTSLQYRFINSRTVAIRYAGAVETPPSTNSTADRPRLRIAAAGESSDGAALEEVLVTAQKREERVQDVPVPVTTLAADALVNQNQLRLQDYYTSVPGLSVAPSIQSQQLVSIRGVTAGALGNPTVGVTVDDVPYGSSTLLGGGLVVPDIDPGDLSRVEILRGPQGTLYGASSMGGLIKFVSADPSTHGITARVEGGISGVKNGAETGYNVRGAVNLPITDALAIRASAFTRQDPGFVDNVETNQRGVNEARTSGGRLSALWQSSEQFSVKLNALLQDSRGHGNSDVNIGVGLGDLQQSYPRGVGGYDRRTQNYSLAIKGKLGAFDLTSITGYGENSFSDSFDYTWAFSDLTESQFGVTGTPLVEHNRTSKFTQELRVSSPISSVIDWLGGAFYTHENSTWVVNLLASQPDTGTVVGSWLYDSFPTNYEEYAAFADFTFHVTDRFDVQVGGRESEIRQGYASTEFGPYVPTFLNGTPSPFILPEVHAKNDAFTYLLTPRYRLSADLMIYARLASGYRAGGPNPNPGGVVPSQYNPDKTENYEIGFKGDFFDRQLSLDASLYYINWKDIQLGLVNPTTNISYTVNGNTARSKGMELSIQARPVRGLTAVAWASLNESILTRDVPPSSIAGGIYGASGDRLPYSSRFSGHFSLQQEFPLTASVSGFVGADVSYVGDRTGEFQSTAVRQDLPAYAKTDFNAGLHDAEWTVTAFVNNVTDRRGVLEGGLGYTPPFAFVYVQPRTVGLSVIKTF